MNKLIYIFISILTFTSLVSADQGPATVFKITMEKVELCTSVTLTDIHDTTCNGSVTVGTGSTTYDIGSVSVGADVGSFVSTAGLPIGTTFTHAKPTMSRKVTLKGYSRYDSNCFCRTESDATFNSSAGKYKSVMYGVCEATAELAAARAEENDYYVGTDGDGSDGHTVCVNAACTSTSGPTTYDKTTSGLNYQYGLAISDPDVNTDSFDMIYKLESPYTIGISAPKMNLAFGTASAVNEQGETVDGTSCLIEMFYPKINITITD